MTTDIPDPAVLEAQALKLPPYQRGRLAESLLDSLDDEAAKETERKWLELSAERYEAYKRGEVESMDAWEFIDRIKEKHRLA